MDDHSKDMFKDLLNEQLATLLKEAADTVGEMSDEEKEGFPDPTDRASVETDRTFTLRIRDRERKLIGKVKEAIERLDAGEFGKCESCGGPISEARLKARPVTTFCIECKKEAEEQEKSAH